MDFKNLIVYQKASETYKLISENLLDNSLLDRIEKDQLKRAALSIVLNIAEGTSRFSNPDRRKFYVIARGSAFECSALLDAIENKVNDEKLLNEIDSKLTEISKMLFVMIRNLKV